MKKLALLLAIVFTILPFAACSVDGDINDTNVTAETTSAPTYIDARGKVVNFETAPSKIICLSPSDTEVLYALGLSDNIIGVSTYSNYPAEAATKPQFGTGPDLSVEALIAAAPDVIIIDKMAQTVEQVDQLDAANIPVIVIESANIEQCYSKIEMLGYAFGKQSEAAKMVKDMKDTFQEISEKAAKQPQKSAYIEISPLMYGLWTCGQGTFQDELLAICNLKNIFGDVQSWKEVSEEEVIARNPDVILSTTGSYSSEDGKAKTEISARPNWAEITAVKDGSIYDVDADMISRAGPRLAQAAKEIYQAVYGD